MVLLLALGVFVASSNWFKCRSVLALLCGVGLMMPLGCGLSAEARKGWDQSKKYFDELRAEMGRSTTAGEYVKREPPARVSLAEDWGEVGRRMVTVAADGERWGAIASDIAAQAGLSVVMPAEAGTDDEGGEVLVTLYLDEATVYHALRMLGSSLGLEPTMTDGVVGWVTVGASELAVMSSGFLSAGDAEEVAKDLLGQSEGVSTIGGSVMIAGDGRAVRRAEELSSVLNQAEPEQWSCSVWFVELSSEFRTRYGVDVSAVVNIEGLITGNAAELLSNGILSAFVEADAGETIGRMLNEATLMLVEGETATIESVEAIPIPKRTVSPEGTVTTIEYEEITAGLSVDLDGYAIPGGLRLNIRPELSAVAGFVEDHPIITRRSLTSSIMIGDGDWVILAGLNQWRDQRDRRGVFLSHRSQDGGHREVLVLMRCRRIPGPAERLAAKPGRLDQAEFSTMPDPIRPGASIIVED